MTGPALDPTRAARADAATRLERLAAEALSTADELRAGDPTHPVQTRVATLWASARHALDLAAAHRLGAVVVTEPRRTDVCGTLAGAQRHRSNAEPVCGRCQQCERVAS